MIISQQQIFRIRPPKMIRLTLLCLFGLTCSQVSADQGTEAIVGGDYARKGDFKYHVTIDYADSQCGGAIIDDHYILTAAHCVTNATGHISKKRFMVIAGTHDLNNRQESIITHAATIYIPKNFDHPSYLHDIAVLKMRRSLQLSHHRHKLEKVNLPKPDAHFDHVCATVTGFGDQEIHVRINSHGKKEEYGGRTDGKMKFANVKVITNEKCSQLNNKPIPPTNICGQVLQRDKNHPEGVCSGDSGGPLVYGGEVIGISSVSPFACDESKKAARYTRVSSYLHFINSVIHGHPGNDVVSGHVTP